MQVGEKQRYVFPVFPYLTSLVQKGQTRGKKQAEWQDDAKKSQVQQSRSQLISKEGMKAATESERQDLSLIVLAMQSRAEVVQSSLGVKNASQDSLSLCLLSNHLQDLKQPHQLEPTFWKSSIQDDATSSTMSPTVHTQKIYTLPLRHLNVTQFYSTCLGTCIKSYECNFLFQRHLT